jgi:hypothetical protein
MFVVNLAVSDLCMMSSMVGFSACCHIEKESPRRLKNDLNEWVRVESKLLNKSKVSSELTNLTFREIGSTLKNIFL